MHTSAKLRRIFLRAVFGLLATSLALRAQLPAPPATTQDALHEMFGQAAIVFTGQVTDLRHVASANGSTGLIEIDFAIDDAILGVAPNTTYTLREWADPSSAAAQFAIARRYLVFLHAPGPSGLTSPVGGPDGAIPILPGNDAASPTTPDAAGLALQDSLAKAARAGTTLRSPAHTNFRVAPQSGRVSPPLASANVDLRWIATRLLTPIAYAPGEPAAAHPITARARIAIAPIQTQLLAAPSANSANSPPSAFFTRSASAEPESISSPPPTPSATYADLLSLLRSWQVQSHAAR